jgi:hypothetical protein
MQWNVSAIPITTLAQFNQHLSQLRAGQAERNRQSALSSTPNTHDRYDGNPSR